MTKYRSKPSFIDVVKYEKGMEDGYAAYKLTGEFVGYYTKDRYPKVNLKPAIKTVVGWHEVKENDYIILDKEGRNFSIISEERLKDSYELVEE